jgi:hypothetical protein
MPYIIRPRGIRSIVATLGALLLVGAAPAVASAECPHSAASTKLAKFGDNALYTLLSGSAQAEAPGWSLDNAEVVSDSGPEGEESNPLVIRPYGRAVSPSFCVTSAYPSFRFFAKQLNDESNGSLNVSLRWTSGWGFQHSVNVGSVEAGSSWTLSPSLKLATALPLRGESSELKVRIEFQPSGNSTWAIDDVYIDPYSR